MNRQAVRIYLCVVVLSQRTLFGVSLFPPRFLFGVMWFHNRDLY